MDTGIRAMGSEQKGFESSKNCNPQHSRPCGEGCLRSVDGSILGRKGALFFMEERATEAVLSFLPDRGSDHATRGGRGGREYRGGGASLEIFFLLFFLCLFPSFVWSVFMFDDVGGMKEKGSSRHGKRISRGFARVHCMRTGKRSSAIVESHLLYIL